MRLDISIHDAIVVAVVGLDSNPSELFPPFVRNVILRAKVTEIGVVADPRYVSKPTFRNKQHGQPPRLRVNWNLGLYILKHKRRRVVDICHHSTFQLYAECLAFLRGVVDQEALDEVAGNVANPILADSIDKELDFFKVAEAWSR